MMKNIYNPGLILKCLAAGSLAFCAMTTRAQNARIVVDASKVMNKIPAYLYGSCIEDVNHEIYGGLYDQRLYGESFEEGAPGVKFKGWKTLQGEWKAADGGVAVNQGEGYKLIYEGTKVTDGSVEADVKFPKGGFNAGFIVRVGREQSGADNFDGYEVSISPSRNTVILGKHSYDFTPLASAKATISPNTWHHIKVEMKGAELSVYLDNDAKPAITHTDTNWPFLTGKIGLRNYNAHAIFKDVVIKQGAATTKAEFTGEVSPQVSAVWDGVKVAGVTGDFALDTATAFNGKQAQIIWYSGGAGKMGIANMGLNRWGISVKTGQKMQGYVYLKADQLSGPVTVALQNLAGSKTYASVKLAGISSAWKKYAFTLTPTATDAKARFFLYIEKAGKLTVDQAVLMSTGASQFKGQAIRADIATKMQQEGLNFVRYGGTMVNAPDYKWKNMTGPPDKRPPYEGHWYPYTSNGFGIEEFVKYVEAAGFESAFAINVEQDPKDVGDMVEYLTGPATSPFGKKRAANGHPKPYPVHYIELGNEEVIWGDLEKDYQHYAERFNLMYDVIHAKDPKIKIVCAAWWRPASPNMELVFKAINGKADYWDLHTDADEPNAGIKVDQNLQQMKDLFLKWDSKTKMKIAIFEENGGLHNMQRALGHATTLNAVRRHGDFVLTSCAANGLQALGQNDNGWDQGQIFFTTDKVWGMPPFYSTQMMAKNHQQLRIFNSVEGDLDVSATRSQSGDALVIHVVNTSARATKTAVDLANFSGRKPTVKVYTLAADLKAENTPTEPDKVSTKETTVQLAGNSVSYTFAPHSYTILRFEK